MPTAKELREKRTPIYKEIRKMADTLQGDKRDFTAEEQTAWKKANDDYNALTDQIGIQERAEALDREQEESIDKRNLGKGDVDHDQRNDGGNGKPPRKPGELREEGDVTKTEFDLAINAWMRAQYEYSPSKSEIRAAKVLGIKPNQRKLDIRMKPHVPRVWVPGSDQRALSIVTGSAGQYTVPQGFVARLEKTQLAFGGVRQVAEVIRTTSGNPLPWPTVNDTGNTGERIAENTQVASADPTFGQVTLNAYKYSSKLILVPHELLEDSEFDVAGMLADLLGERLGRIQNTDFTTADGSSKPQGIVTASALGKTTAGATAITSDEIIDLIHSINPAYRSYETCKFMMNDGILAYIRKLKDTTNRYLWEMSMQVGVPDKLLNYPIVINQDMQATVATATKTMLFGDMSKMKIRDVGQIRLRRLVERYADYDQEGFVALTRADGRGVGHASAIKHMLQA